MHTQQVQAPLMQSQVKFEEKVIDTEKIRSLLSKKLATSHATNPQDILNHLEDHINSKVEKVQAAIFKNKQRQNKIKTVETRQLQSRSLLEQKLKLKLNRSSKKKLIQDKQKLQSKIAARKLKQQFFTTRKQQIHQTQFRKRLEKFKQIKAQNQFHLQNLTFNPSQTQKSKTLKRSFSVNENPIQKRKQIQQIQYFKKLQALQKRKVFQKAEKIISLPQRIDKTQWIQKIKSQTQERYIQKLGLDLLKIQQARRTKQKSIIQKVNKLKKQSELKDQQRGYRTQSLKQQIHAKIKTHREVLNKKNQRFLTMRNKSNPLLQRNISGISQNRDSFEMSTKRGFFESTNKMSKTLENFKQMSNLSTMKAQSYYEKQREEKLKKNLVNHLDEILKREKINSILK